MNNLSDDRNLSDALAELPFPEAARRALLLWMGVVCLAMVVVPTVGFVHRAPQPVRLGAKHPAAKGDATVPYARVVNASVDRPAEPETIFGQRYAGIDTTIVTHSTAGPDDGEAVRFDGLARVDGARVLATMEKPDFATLGLRGAVGLDLTSD